MNQELSPVLCRNISTLSNVFNIPYKGNYVFNLEVKGVKGKKKRCQGSTNLDMKTKICDHIWERQLDIQCEGLFSNCTVQLYLHDDDRKQGGDKENPEMPHGGVKIGHLARETAREGAEENQKEGKTGA